MKKLYSLLLAVVLIFTIANVSAQSPCTLTGASVYVDHNLTPVMMNASVNGMSQYTYIWSSGAAANQTVYYSPWCVTITDIVTGCDTIICENCIADSMAVCPCPMIYMPVCGCDGVQYSNYCIAECAGVGWSPAVSNGMPGGFLPCTTPSWDCTPGQGCSDPGTGNGSYTSLADCQANCTVTSTWECDPVQGCFDPGTGLGTYTTFTACDTACSIVNASWDCINGACIDPLTGLGSYTNYSTCVTACVTPTWDCVNGACVDPGTGSGQFSTLSYCQSNCIAQTWDCVNNFCFDPGTGNGAYATQGACDTACAGVTPSWDCNLQGCFDPGTGQGTYASFASCDSICGITAIKEDISNIKIYPNPTKNTLMIDGRYFSVSIYNLFGKEVLTSDYQNIINVAALSNGIYFIRINTSTTFTIKKIIIAK
jgi:hypothetical protein